MPRYTTTPYGLAPRQGPRFPTNAQAIASAPLNSARPIAVFERDGTKHHALFYKGEWRRVVAFPRDSHTGQVRVAMDGTSVANPIAWASS
jgi:hypothetical protein